MKRLFYSFFGRLLLDEVKSYIPLRSTKYYTAHMTENEVLGNATLKKLSLPNMSL